MSKVKSKTIISVGVAIAFSVTTIKIDRAKANPALLAPAAPAICVGTAGVGCVVIGTVIIAGTIYYVWQNTKTKETYTATVRGEVFTQEGGEQYPVGRVVTRGMVRTLQECQQEASRYAREHGGVWEALPLARTGVSGPEAEGIDSEPMFLCQIRRVK
ncbi:MAG: hypothetical protein HXY43_21385 [Fischerella sp.]|uniref:hypothetical protein n=1 Tax=Fischerella sp. TaxID=1191 RepID=UPI0017AD3E19|nr:hypothetical protein [Fischerella sp.]NWF61736.1 hypothetical protein [Fischerella sp.]